MAVSLIASANAAAFTTGNGSISIANGGTTVKGVIVLIHQNGSATDEISGVDYDGVAMTEVAGSPNAKATGEPGAVYCYFLGSSIPTGTPKTVTITVNGGASAAKRASCLILSDSGDTEIIDVDATINSDSQANPSVTLSLGGRDGFCCLVFHSGHGSTALAGELSDWNSVQKVDYGNQVGGVLRYSIVDDLNVTAGWSQTAEDATAICIAVGSAAAVATAYTFTGPTSGTVNVASTNFTVTPNGTSTATVTPATDGSGSFTPSSVTFDGTAAAKTFTYTPTDVAGSPHTLSTSDDGGLTETSGTIDYTVNAAGGAILVGGHLFDGGMLLQGRLAG